jgi:prepilin-type N-terminal cleavage/methylation domain-containing protein
MRYRPSRQGFTLVELLVAVALIFFIMSILTAAFLASSKSFTDLKAEGDMAEKLGTAVNILRKYLVLDHFEGKRRISDPAFWMNGPPQEGFFRIYQGTPSGTSPNVLEGTDTMVNGLSSFRVINHALHFAVKPRGDNVGDFLAGGVPASSTLLSVPTPEYRYQTGTTTYTSQWGEVAFFLQPLNYSGTEAIKANGTPLYGLYMRQLLATPDKSGSQVTVASATTSSFVEVSGVISGGTMNCNGPRDLTQVSRRFGMNTANLSGVTNNTSTITAATQAAPILITTSNNHGLTTGNPIIITGATGNTAANGIWTVTVPAGSLNTFTLDGSDGTASGAYNSGSAIWSSWYTTLAQDAPSTTALLASDLLLPNVVSFEVRVMLAGGSTFVDLYDPTVTSYANSNPAFSTTNGPMVYDTWSSVVDNSLVAGGGPGFDYSTWATAGTNASIPLYNITSGTISGATMAKPIVITTSGTSTGLQNGDMVTISGVGGNTAANGTWTIGSVTPNTTAGTTTFSLNNSDGTGSLAYTAGGTWTKNGPIIKALQITLRVWDDKTENTRQVSFVVPM